MKHSRRVFIHRSTAALAGVGLTTAFPQSLLAQKHRVAPSDKIRFGVVGCRGMGFVDLTSAMKVPEVEGVALCDVDRSVLEERAAELTELVGTKPDLYGDYREMLDDQTIDAIIVGTPDHWHPLIMIDALEAGKDVYVEKPLANTIEECDVMVRAAKQHDRIVQVGQWQRSGPHWNDVFEFVQSGKLGSVRTVKAWAYMPWDPPEAKPNQPVPEGVDYDMWLGPAPDHPFNPNRFHFTFRWFWDYAGGLMTDWGVHLIDMVLAGMRATAPNAVLSSGGMFAKEDSGMETPDTQQAIYEFDDFAMIWEHAVGISNGPYGRRHGVAFIGNNGTLVADRGGWEIIPETEDDAPKMQIVSPQERTGSDLDRHTQNFVESMKSRQAPNCPPEVARLAAVNAHLGNVAFRTGRKVYWNHEQRTFVDDAEASALVKADYRDPWKLPKY